MDERDDIFTAGRIVEPGTYLRVDVPNGRTVDLRRQDALPASLDGMVALYRRLVPLDTPPTPTQARPAGKRLVAID